MGDFRKTRLIYRRGKIEQRTKENCVFGFLLFFIIFIYYIGEKAILIFRLGFGKSVVVGPAHQVFNSNTFLLLLDFFFFFLFVPL